MTAHLPVLQARPIAANPRPRGSLPVLAAPTTERFIHLLYAPTNFCNMGCSYCYLGTGTDVPTGQQSPLGTLDAAIQALASIGVVPFNLSFHGGEPTAIPREHLRDLFAYARDHYRAHGDRIKAAGFPLNPVHIKTNLYNFDRLYDLFSEFGISVSGSVDLPLSLHARYRTDKQGRSTRPRIERNLRLLAGYPHHKKISCVVTRQHLAQLDALIDDIRFVHDDIGLDMTRFNVMFSFDSHRNQEKFGDAEEQMEMLDEDEQVYFYRRLRDAFAGTSLQAGLEQHWFKEFTPEFCCSAVNCGSKFFLLQNNGDVYSCPRGQSSERFRYGNVLHDDIRDVLGAGERTIEAIENTLGLHADCQQCEYVPYCNAGCTFVRQETARPKSYTCALQKELYRADLERYPPLTPAEIKPYVDELRFRNDISSLNRMEPPVTRRRTVTPELASDENTLTALIERDATLQAVYATDTFLLRVDGVDYPLESAVLTEKSDIALIRSDSEVDLLVARGVFDANCAEPVNNTLLLMFLRNTLVTYGDEGRQKQEHLADYALYQRSFEAEASAGDDSWLRLDLMPLLRLHRRLFLPEVRNNLFVTTRALRDTHYKKQQKNAFYHIQAINLPFPHLEFVWRESS